MTTIATGAGSESHTSETPAVPDSCNNIRNLLANCDLKTAKFAPSSTNRPKTGTDSSQVAPTGPSNPNGLNRCYKGRLQKKGQT